METMDSTIRAIRTDSFDFVVCGGGPAGFSTALSSARKGLRVALIEKLGCLGGVSTSGGIHYFLGGRKLNERTKEHVRVIGGIFDEFTDSLIQEGNAIEPNSIDMDFNPVGWYPRMASGISCDPFAIKLKMEQMLLEAGVRIYFHTDLVQATVEGKTIVSILVHNKDGFVGLKARLFADCTGDGDLAVYSGCSYEQGRAEDGLTCPSSLEMVVDNVDGDTLVRYQNAHQSPKLIEIIEDLKHTGVWDFPYEIFVCMQLVQKDVFLINTIRQIGVDGTSEQSVSEALMDGRQQNLRLFGIMKEYFPGFGNARIRWVSDWMGIRETRRIAGLHRITLQDALGGARYADCVAATTYNFDLPDPLKPSYDPMLGDAKHPNAIRRHTVIQIPFRSMLSPQIDNLVVAGRCISCDREVLGPVRIMGPCMQMGQAAGTAAALVAKGTTFKQVSMEKLRTTLWTDGVLNPEQLPFD
ncbi:MAG: FAD-dependent oxidoreductase [Sphaerochaetaceae bacterium]|jgi:hypothetical protein